MNAHPASVTLSRIRVIVALLATATAVGGLIELTMLRHWDGIQLVPWVVLGLVAVVGAVTARGGPPRLAQATGALGLLGGGIGVWQHAAANHALGAQLAQYSQTWDGMSALQQWWLAATGAVGAAPAPAPGMLALAGVLLIVAVLDRD